MGDRWRGRGEGGGGRGEGVGQSVTSNIFFVYFITVSVSFEEKKNSQQIYFVGS